MIWDDYVMCEYSIYIRLYISDERVIYKFCFRLVLHSRSIYLLKLCLYSLLTCSWFIVECKTYLVDNYPVNTILVSNHILFIRSGIVSFYKNNGLCFCCGFPLIQFICVKTTSLSNKWLYTGLRWPKYFEQSNYQVAKIERPALNTV